MQLKECYTMFGGDYEAVLGRIPKDTIIEKFMVKFLTEPSFGNLVSNFETANYEEAFRAAHSLKGVCQNLGFDRLAKSVSDLTELLRHYDTTPVDRPACEEALSIVTKDYQAVIDAINRYVEENN